MSSCFTDQIAVNIESHRLKGLAVGKCYTEYIPPSTSAENSRPNGVTSMPTQPATPAATQNLANSRNSNRNTTMPSPLSNCQSTTPSRAYSNLDQAMMQSAQAMHISQINNAYLQRHKSKLEDLETPKQKVVMKATENGYVQTPVLFSDSCEGEKSDGTDYLHAVQNAETLHQEYTPYQNVKQLCHMQEELNK